MTYEMDKVMKVLAIVNAVFVPLTFLAGVYGMNFKHQMVELTWEWGYTTFWVICLILTFAQVLYFRYRKWV